MDLMRYVAIQDYDEVDPQDKRTASLTEIFTIAEMIRCNNKQAQKNQNILTLLPLLEQVKVYKEKLLTCPVVAEEVKPSVKLKTVKNNVLISSSKTTEKITQFSDQRKLFTVYAGSEIKYVRERAFDKASVS